MNLLHPIPDSLLNSPDYVLDISFNFHGNRCVACLSNNAIAVYDALPVATTRTNAHPEELQDKLSNPPTPPSAHMKPVIKPPPALHDWTLTAYIRNAHDSKIVKSDWAHPQFGQMFATCSADGTLTVWAERCLGVHDSFHVVRNLSSFSNLDVNGTASQSFAINQSLPDPPLLPGGGGGGGKRSFFRETEGGEGGIQASGSLSSLSCAFSNYALNNHHLPKPSRENYPPRKNESLYHGPLHDREAPNYTHNPPDSELLLMDGGREEGSSVPITTPWFRTLHTRSTNHSLTCVKFSPYPYGSYVATSSLDGMIRVYETQDLLALNDWSYNCIEFHPSDDHDGGGSTGSEEGNPPGCSSIAWMEPQLSSVAKISVPMLCAGFLDGTMRIFGNIIDGWVMLKSIRVDPLFVLDISCTSNIARVCEVIAVCGSDGDVSLISWEPREEDLHSLVIATASGSHGESLFSIGLNLPENTSYGLLDDGSFQVHKDAPRSFSIPTAAKLSWSSALQIEEPLLDFGSVKLLSSLKLKDGSRALRSSWNIEGCVLSVASDSGSVHLWRVYGKGGALSVNELLEGV